MIKAENIVKSYGNLPVLKDVSLSINKGELVSIVGASGAGKTTLLQILGTLDNADKGELIINDTNIASLSAKKLAAFRNNNIGFVFQFHHLLPEFSALENICIPAFINGRSRKEAEQRAKELLDFFGLTNRASHKPEELSGGEQQRIAVARALINKPAVVFADEPSGNLDSNNANELHQLFLQLQKDFNQTFVIVTHNKDLAALSDRTLEMKDGLLIS